MSAVEAPGAALAAAATGCLGVRFRLHGRDPATGLDCIGLLGAALAAIGRPVDLPSGYALRTAGYPGMEHVALVHGFRPAIGATAPGDIWLLRPGPGQVHLGIVAPDGTALIEAHAGLRRVVLTPRPEAELPDQLVARWRL